MKKRNIGLMTKVNLSQTKGSYVSESYISHLYWNAESKPGYEGTLYTE